MSRPDRGGRDESDVDSGVERGTSIAECDGPDDGIGPWPGSDGAEFTGSSMELLLIGLDAACLSVLEPLIDAGETPTIGGLVKDGIVGPLESQIPPWTASAWPTLYTGKNPGKHGVYDFLSFDGYDWDVVNATHVRERPIWELLSEYGLTSVVVNVPVTHPARAFDGALIPGMTAPESPAEHCHPPGIYEDVTDVCGEYYVYPQSTPDPDESIDGYERVVECRGSAFRYLSERFEPDFGFLQFQQSDSVFHERSGDKAAVEAVYRAVDHEIERTIAALEPTNVLVVSDHGIGPVGGHEFRLNEHLREHGYLTATNGGEGMPNWSREWENALLEGEDPTEHEPGATERAMNLAAKVGITTQRIAGALDLVGLKEPIGRRVPNDLIRAASEQVDFEASRAYVRSKSELGVRINLAGREPNGQVPESAYERVRNDLVEELSAVRTPDGEPMFEAVEPRETYFHGPMLDEAPDIVLVPTAFDNAIVGDLGGDRFAAPFEPWNHKRTGVLVAAGEAFDETATIDDATILDVAPTICSVFDIPVDADMDGSAIPIVRSSEVSSYPAYDPREITATDDSAVEDRLSDLGYL